MKRFGLLTSGGDCPGLNAALRGIAKALYTQSPNVLLYGIRNGFTGLINGEYVKMKPEQFSGILTLGGTILGTSRQPFKLLREEGSVKPELMMKTYEKLKLDGLFVLGGNGTHKTANLLFTKGMNIITLPKTIDNDLWGTDVSFGFHSAVERATDVIDCIHTTATSHNRIFIIELMGHNAGWLTLYAGLGGGADVILIPEIPYEIDAVVRAIDARSAKGKEFTIIAMAEGAISREEAELSPKELKARREAEALSRGYLLAREVERATGRETRVAVPGHYQRGGSPCPYDRILATRLGTAAAEMALARQFGFMAAVVSDVIVPVPLFEVAGKLKRVPPDFPILKSARDTGISLGV